MLYLKIPLFIYLIFYRYSKKIELGDVEILSYSLDLFIKLYC